jgi:hypothetical protein
MNAKCSTAASHTVESPTKEQLKASNAPNSHRWDSMHALVSHSQVAQVLLQYCVAARNAAGLSVR